MKYLITGGAGFIGSHLVEKLIARGDQVVVFDNLSTGSAINLSGIKEKITFHEGNILDKAAIDKLVSESDYVVHLAAALGVLNIVNKPLESLRTNLQGSEVVLEAETLSYIVECCFNLTTATFRFIHQSFSGFEPCREAWNTIQSPIRTCIAIGTLL